MGPPTCGTSTVSIGQTCMSVARAAGNMLSSISRLGLPRKPVGRVTPERWSRIKEIFGAARERPEWQRAAFLDAACDGDAGLRAEVAALLAEGVVDSLSVPPPV